MNREQNLHSDNKLIVMIVGSAGAGKNTIMDRVKYEFGEDFIKHFPSCTTRPIRESEMHGREHFFMTKEEMFALVKEHRIVELKKVYNNLYGTDIKVIEDTLLHTPIAMKDYDVEGYANAKKRINYIREKNGREPLHIVSILIDAPDDQLIARMKNRHDNTDVSAREQELIKDRVIKNHSKYDYRVMNNDLETAINEVVGIIKHEYERVTGKSIPENAKNSTNQQIVELV
ncbi:MAG: hypothetical protein IJ301_03570 [Clostridia bacterium]|nr:hypothetical protein [Clostridia bacterium]